MRTIKELLTVMLNNPRHLDQGLCFSNAYLYSEYKITEDEHQEIKAYIRINRPSKWSSIAAFRNRNKVFWWPQGDAKSRIKWLKKHIKLNS